MLLIVVVTGFLLASISTLEQMTLKILLIGLFGIVGFLSIRNITVAYLVFLFLFPIAPSMTGQPGFPAFHFEDFLFFSFTFWWSLKRSLSRTPGLLKSPLKVPILSMIVFFGLSASLALLRYNILSTDLFLLKLKEHWNVFLPWSPLNDTGSLRALLTIGEGVLFYFITVDLLDQKEKIQKATRVFFYSSACVAFFGLLQHVFQFRLLDLWMHDQFGISRINSTFPDPNSLAAYLAAALVLGSFSIFPARKRSTLVLLVLIATALFLTASRSSWTALVLVVLLLPLVARKVGCDPAPHLSKRWGFLLKHGYVIVFALMLVGFFKVSFYSIPAGPQNGSGTLQYVRWRWERTLKGRPGVWHGAALMFQADPIYGNGLGTFPRAIGKYEDVVPFFYRKENAHNYYLQILAETGLIGLFFFMATLTLIVRQGIRCLRKAKQTEDFLLAYGLLAGILIFLVSSLAQHPLLLSKLQLVFWFMVGSLMALSRVSGNEPNPFPLSHRLWKIMILIAVAYVPFQVYAILQTRQVPPYEYGFYDWEDAKPVPFRQIAKRRTISLLPVKERRLAMDIAPLNKPPQRKPPFVEVYVNNQFVERAIFSHKGWHTIICDLSSYRPNELIRLELVFGNAQNLGLATRPFVWLPPRL